MTNIRFPASRLLAPLGAVAISLCVAQICIARPASAQNLPGSGSGILGTPTGPVVGNGPKGPDKPKEQAPAAIPGAESHGEAAPATKEATDMQPTEALFDAINRGDIASARDALNRGADFSGRNVLGMTPTELSVDLGRNDITFLLLSLRGAGGSDDQPAPAATTSASRNAPRPGPKGRASQLAATAPDEQPSARISPARATRPPLAPNGVRIANSVPVVTPASAPLAPARQYAGSGTGTPIPQVGFLGFGGGTSR